MPIDTKYWGDFSSGWNPNDDAINGRKNALLKMDNVELDKNGALSLSNGCSVLRTFGDSAAHSIYSRFLDSIRFDWTALTSGKLYRNSTLLNSAGSTSRTAFSTAFDFALIASGDCRIKDNGTTTANLGISAPTVAPSITQLIYKTPPIVAAATDVNAYHGTTGSVVNVGGIDYLNTWQVDGTDFGFVFETYDSANTRDTTVLTQTNFGSTTTPSDDNDFFIVNPFTIDGSGNPDQTGTALLNVTYIQIQVLISRPASLSPTIQSAPDYFVYNWTSDLLPNGDDIRTVSGSNIILAPRRASFTRVGNDTSKSWATVVGYALVIHTTGAMSGVCGMYIPQIFQGGHSGQLSGNIQFAQMNVAVNNSYVAKSTLGPIGIGAGFVNAGDAVLAQTPTDPQVTDVWIFRRDGGLSEWYRVLSIPIANVGTRQIDLSSNDDAQTLDITVNLNLVSINSTGISDPILEIVGPISGRWYYFTNQFLYPSDINNPDLVDVSEGIRLSGGASQKFLWVQKVSEAAVLVGMSNDVYLLTGTFSTLADGSIDIFYRPLGCKYPPVSRSSAFFSGSVYYMSTAGWTSISSSGSNQILVTPSHDLLYQGKDRYGYTSINITGEQPGSVLYPVIVSKSKLWCSVTGTGRVEVYDFIRHYWRTFTYGAMGTPGAFTETQDGQILAYYSDNKQRIIDDSGTKLIDGATNQTVNILSTAQDGGSPRNRKDLSTLKSRIYTSGGDCTISILTDQGTTTITAANSRTLNSEIFADISQLLSTCKWWQFQLSGSMLDFLLQDISIDFDLRPTPLTYVFGKADNFNSGSKKRVRTWPFIIDTRNGAAVLTPIVDGVSYPPLTIITNEKRTILYQFITDVFGIDYAYKILNTIVPFEFYGDMQPTIVQTLPIAKRFDQIGPFELFRYAKLQKIDIHLLPFGVSVPYRIYFNDTLILSQTLTTVSGIEGAYTINLPKGTAGAIFRIELGPTNFDFHRFDIRILVNTSGRDTEGQWFSLK